MEPVSSSTTLTAPPISAAPPPSAPPAAGPGAGPTPAAVPATPVAGATGPAAAPGSPPGTPPSTPTVPPPAAPADPRDVQLAQITADRERLAAEVAKLTPYAQLGYQYGQNKPVVQPVTPAAAPTQVQVNAYGVPQFDTGLLDQLTTDAAGNVVEKPGAPPGTAVAYQAFQRAKGKFLSDFAADPDAVLNKAMERIEKTLTDKVLKTYESKTTEQQNSAAVEQIMARNGEWLFEKGADGKPVETYDALTNTRTPKMTPAGELWAKHVKSLRGMGMTDPVAIDQYARTAAAQELVAIQQSGNPAAPAAPVVPTVPPTNETLKAQFEARLQQGLPNQLPTPNAPVPPATPAMSLKDQLRQNMIAGGHAFPQPMV